MLQVQWSLRHERQRNTVDLTALFGMGATAARQVPRGAAQASGDVFAALLHASQGQPTASVDAQESITALGFPEGTDVPAATALLGETLEAVEQGLRAELEALPQPPARKAVAVALADAAQALVGSLEQFDRSTGGNSLSLLVAQLEAGADRAPHAGNPQMFPSVTPNGTATTAATLFQDVRAALGLPPSEAVGMHLPEPARGTGWLSLAGAMAPEARAPEQRSVPAEGSAALAVSRAEGAVPGATGGKSVPALATQSLAAGPAGTPTGTTELPTNAQEVGKQHAQRPAGLAVSVSQAIPPLSESGEGQMRAAFAAAVQAAEAQQRAAPASEAAVRQEGARPPSELQQNLMGQIRKTSFSEGTTRIELTPRGLGGLEIELQPAEAGKLRVVIRAENPMVLQALRSDGDTLMSMLGGRGSGQNGAELDFQQSGRNAGGHTFGQTAGSSAEEEEEVAAPVAERTGAIAGDGRLDIFT